MRGALVIAGKDLRNTFLSPLFYILSGICSLVWTFMFTFSIGEFVEMSNFQKSPMGPNGEGLNLHFSVIIKHISLVNLIMIFAVGALTMRLFTEEKRNRTFDLLLTSPVTATEIMMGKFIAGVLTVWALLLVSFLYPLSLAPFGQLDWGPLASSYLGLMLLTASYVAIGIFTSSLTQSAVLAVIMATIFNIMLWFIGAASEVTDDPLQKAIFEQINVSTHFFNFIKGNVSLAAIAFFVSTMALFSFLTQRVVESARWR